MTHHLFFFISFVYLFIYFFFKSNSSHYIIYELTKMLYMKVIYLLIVGIEIKNLDVTFTRVKILSTASA